MTQKSFFPFLLLVLLYVTTAAQNAKPVLQLEDETQLSKIPVAYAAPLSSKQNHCIDTIDLSGLMPPVGDQGVQYSCAAWALGYACRSYYNTNGQPGYFSAVTPESAPDIVSPTFIYNSLNHKRWDAVIKISAAMELMKITGSCSYQSMPYSVGCNVPPTKKQAQEAQNFKIETFGRLDTLSIINGIVGQLKNKQPVVIGSIYGRSYFENGKLSPDTGRYMWRTLDTVKNGHAVVIVGFDERIQAFKIMNSMGDKWGNKGYGWISYDIAPKVINSAYVIKPYKKQKALPVKKETIKPVAKETKPEKVFPKEKSEMPKAERVPVNQSADNNAALQITAAEKTSSPESEPKLSLWQKFKAWRAARQEVKEAQQAEKNADPTVTPEAERTNRFSVKLEKAVQSDSTRFDLNLKLDVSDCACDSFQIAVQFFWGDISNRTKKAGPVLSYNPDYSLANNQAAIILDKREFSGKASDSIRISIPLDQMAIPKGIRTKDKYIKAINRLIAEAVWYNDDFAIKSCAILPVDVYY